MKYNININQLALAGSKLDLMDCAILDYLVVYCNSKSPAIDHNRLIDKYGLIWTWISYQSIIDNNPLLRIKAKSVISERINRIARSGFIKIRFGNGRKLYILLTEKVDSLFFKSPKRVR